jgi:diacylglycerol kinase family enzyme
LALVALLSNPHSTGNRSLLPEVRCFCAQNPDIFHYEVEEIGQIAKALEMIARVKPKVLVINGGDGTVQAALTELYHGGHFDSNPPPVAVLPNGKTNLIAFDLGAHGDPMVSLERILGYAKGDLAPHIVERELIALSNGSKGARPVLGMFLGGAGLAETILYCRNKIYPLGLPNGVSHFLAAMAALFGTIFVFKSRFLPHRSSPIRISLLREGELQGSFSVLIVTTLEKLLLGASSGDNSNGDVPRTGHMKFMAVDQGPMALLRLMLASLRGKLGQHRMTGVHIEQGDTIQIDGDKSSVILDGEVFEANFGFPILLRSTAPVPFLRLAA